MRASGRGEERQTGRRWCGVKNGAFRRISGRELQRVQRLRDKVPRLRDSVRSIVIGLTHEIWNINTPFFQGTQNSSSKRCSTVTRDGDEIEKSSSNCLLEAEKSESKCWHSSGSL